MNRLCIQTYNLSRKTLAVVVETVTPGEDGGGRYAETLGVAKETMAPNELRYLNRHRKPAQTVSEGVSVRQVETHT